MSNPVFSTSAVIDFILARPRDYPGVHNLIQPRTSRGLAELDTMRQTQVVWDAMCLFVESRLLEGRGINFRGFGCFTFEPLTFSDDYGRDHMRYRPCFIPAKEFQQVLYRSAGKEQVRTMHGSIYQQGIIDCLNIPVVAAGAYYQRDVVKSTLETIFRGMIDIVTREIDLEIDFGFAIMKVTGRNLSVSFDPKFTRRSQKVPVQWPLLNRSCSDPNIRKNLSDIWRKPRDIPPVMNFYKERPYSAARTEKRMRTAKLGILSYDMSSVIGGTSK